MSYEARACLLSLLAALLAPVAAAQLDLAWGRPLGGAGVDTARAVAATPDGGLVACGYFNFTVDFDPGPGLSTLTATPENSWVASFDASGELRWVKQIGPLRNRCQQVAVDAAGNLYLAGSFRNTADFDPGPGVFRRNGINGGAWIASWTSAGEFRWAGQLGDDSADVEALVVHDGRVAAAGFTLGPDGAETADLDPGPGVYAVTEFSAFVLELDLSGAFLAVKTFSHAKAQALAATPDGGLVVGGYFTEPIDLDPGPGTDLRAPIGSWNGWLVKLSAGLDYEWGGVYAAGGGEDVSSLAAAPDGRIAVVVKSKGPVDADPGAGETIIEVSASGGNTLVWLAGDGRLLEARRLGDTRRVFPETAVVFDYAGRLYAVSTFIGSFDPGGGAVPLTTLGGDDVVLNVFDTAAGLVESVRLGSAEDEIAPALALGSEGEVLIGGWFERMLDLDPGPGEQIESSAGNLDGFLLALAPLPAVAVPGLSSAGALIFAALLLVAACRRLA